MMVFVFFLVMILCLLLLVAFLVLVERNLLGLDQLRKGPNITSWFSIMQTVSDSIKLLLKNYLINPSVRVFFFLFSPMLGLFLSLLNWFFISVSMTLTFLEFSVVVSLFLSSILVYSVVWASWSSSNTYSLISSIRAVAQMISYEVIMGLFIFMMILNFSSFNWEFFSFFNGDSSNLIFYVFLFSIWLIIILAELNRTPFDLVESESELVGGFNVEYSSSSFTLLFLSEYMNIWFMSLVSVVIFYSFFFGFCIVFFFVLLMVSLVVHIRSLLPRYKFFDLIVLTWKVLLPVILCVIIYLSLY